MPAGVLALVPVGLLVIMVGWNVFYLGNLATNILGVLYPIVKSYQALGSDDKADDTQWLSYWLRYSLFQFINTTFGFALSYIPLYNLVQVFILLWLQNPIKPGATSVF